MFHGCHTRLGAVGAGDRETGWVLRQATDTIRGVCTCTFSRARPRNRDGNANGDSGTASAVAIAQQMGMAEGGGGVTLGMHVAHGRSCSDCVWMYGCMENVRARKVETL